MTIQLGNINVACVSDQIALQLNAKTNTLSGIINTIFQLIQFPVEGWFERDSSGGIVENQIYEAILALYRSWNSQYLVMTGAAPSNTINDWITKYPELMTGTTDNYGCEYAGY